MANSTLTPNTRQEQDDADDPVRRAKALHAAEQREAFDRDFENPERLAKDGKPGDLAGGALKREQNSPQEWVTSIGKVIPLVAGPVRGSGIAKSKSPLVAIIIIIFGGGFTFAGLLSAFSLLPIDVVSQFFDKEDAQNTSLTIRTNLIINDKISKDITQGFCTSKPFLCKYEKPSNKLLKALAKEGVQAFDKKGNLIDGKGILPNNTRPDHFVFTDSKGVPKAIPATEFSSTLASDPEFRAAFHNAYTPKFIGYADSVFQKIKARFGFTTDDKNASAKDSKDVTNNLNEESAGSETGAGAAEEAETAAKAAGSTATTEADKAADNLIIKLLKGTATNVTKSVADGGKGNAVGLIAGAACALGDIPSLIEDTVRAYQLAQLIGYGVTFVTSVEAMKAGDATPQETSGLGDLLTSFSDGKSALDSFGIKNVLFGDTQTTDPSWKGFVPGASAEQTIGGLAQALNSPAKKDVCSVATNPATGAAIDAASSETIVGPLANAIIGYVASVGLELAGPYLIDFVTSLIPPGTFTPLLQFFLGDLTKGLVGEKVGDALTSGIVHLMGQTANAGGNVALTVAEKLAYDNTTAQVNLAYAQEDRATLSPFDASNPNTMLGSFVSQLLPYYSNMGSIGGIASTLGSMVTGSIGSIIKQSTAGAVDATGAQYELCDDPAITDPGADNADNTDPIAAGPFCNIEYGIPPQFLNKDPEEVANDLITSGDIDKTTGDVVNKTNDPINSVTGSADGKGSLSGWMQLCDDGTTTNAANCELNNNSDPLTVDYALYTIDHRVQSTMDGDDPVLDPPASTDNTTTATPTTTAPTTPAPSTDTTNTTTAPPAATPAPAPATTDTTTTDTAAPSAYINTGSTSSSIDKLFGFLGYWLPPKRYEGITI